MMSCYHWWMQYRQHSSNKYTLIPNLSHTSSP